MKKIVEWLDGKKTYIGIFLTFVGGGLTAIGYPEIGKYLLGIGATVTAVGFRGALKKLEPEYEE